MGKKPGSGLGWAVWWGSCVTVAMTPLLLAVREAVHVDLRQARRLVTHEDARFMHLHKLLGVAVLAHFAYRAAVWCRLGHLGLGAQDDAAWPWWLAVHALLHVTSFEFAIPARRNAAYNVIWPEMRWHSLVFAYRSLAVLSLVWLERRGVLPPAHGLAMRAALVFATMAAADLATWRLGDGSTTMRGNPYPRNTPPLLARALNLFYATSQVFATLNMLFRGPELVFLTLVPIQTAPLLMTLEKKGIIKQAGWHAWYAAAVAISYAYAHLYTSDAAAIMPVAAAVVVARFGLRVNKYVTWAAVVAYAATRRSTPF